MSREIELKLEVDPDDLPLVRRDPVLAARESRTKSQVTVYYDTPEKALKKHGWTLRVRNAGGRFTQTVKPTSESAGLIAREEIECELPTAEPEVALLDDHPVASLLHGVKANTLQPVIRSEATRTSWRVEGDSGRIQVDLDQGTIIAGGHRQDFAEIEFELVDGSPRSLLTAARRLSDHAPVRLGVLTKAERGFLVAANSLHRVHKAASVRVDRQMNIAEAFETIIHGCIKHYRLNEPLVLRERKAAALHQARVAMRRLRSAFSLFKPAAEDMDFQHLRHELRWFTSQLGDARNLDVFLQRDLELADRQRAQGDRDRAYDVVIDAMNSARFRRLLIDLVGWAAMGAWRSSRQAQRPLESFAHRRLDRLWQSIIDNTRLARMDDVTRHELRIRIKKLRYGVEFMHGLYPRAHAAEKRFGGAVEELQEELGKLNDMAAAHSLGATKSGGGWLIGSLAERKHLMAAEHAMRELTDVGPFWHDEEVEGAA